MDLGARVRLDSRAVLSEFRDGAVLLDLRTKHYFVLNGTAGLVCQRLSEGAVVADLVSALVSAYRVEPTDAEADVCALLDELSAASLVCPA